ncbi:hypothetical protein CQW23_18533 [Capsicum baccatum]|uniref:FF domain-containing protein n=1 Tax=Capsicum baccatum TaxID=33114 RepID=A0A2G2W3B4_CAPBA|nr:hypothetical protein CQW23_18533 [Capsicum baccatum]
MSPPANLPTIMASKLSSLSGKVSSPMIKIVKMKNSSKPASPAVANSKKIGIAVTLGNSVKPPVSEITTTQDAVVYGDGFSLENRENVKKDDAVTEIGGATLSDLKIVKLGPLIYERKAEAKSEFKTFLESINIGSDCTWDQEHAKALKEQKCNRVKYLEFLKSCDFIKEYIRDLESEEKEQRKLRMIKDFVAYLAVSSNTSGSTEKDLFTNVMDKLEKQSLAMLVMIVVIIEIFGIEVTVMILAIGSGGDGCDVKLVNVISWSCDGGIVVSTDTIASVLYGGGRGGAPVTVVVMVYKECVEVDDVLVVVSDVWKLMICWWILVVVLVLIDELVGSRDRPVVVDDGGVGGRGVHGSIWYLDDKSQIKNAVRMDKEITASLKWEDIKSLFGDRKVFYFAFIDLELETRLQGPLENDN